MNGRISLEVVRRWYQQSIINNNCANKVTILLIYNETFSTRYTFDEDKKIIEFMHKTLSTKPFYELGILLNRPATSVQMRYAHLTSDKNKSPIKWTTYMSERMVKGEILIIYI